MGGMHEIFGVIDGGAENEGHAGGGDGWWGRQ